MNLQESIKQDLLRFEGFQEEVTEDNSIPDSFTYNRDGVPTEYDITDRDKYVIGMLTKLRGIYQDLNSNGIELESTGSRGNSMERLYDDLMYEIDRYVRYFLEIPALDGGEYDHSHPFLG